MYVSGTKHADSIVDTILDHSYESIPKNIQTGRYQDVWDDLKLPFHKTYRTERYTNVQDELDRNLNIKKKLVSHSLGSAVAYEAQDIKSDINFNIVAYSPPLTSKPGDPSGQNRYRNMFDPVSMFDGGATTSVNISQDFYNPHSYSNTSANNFTNTQPTNSNIFQGVGNVLPPEQRTSVNTQRYMNPQNWFLTE